MFMWKGEGVVVPYSDEDAWCVLWWKPSLSYHVSVSRTP